MKAFLSFVLGLALTACEHDSNTTDNTAPVLDSVGNKEIAVGDTFSLTLQATDTDGDALLYTSDGGIGPGKNPYAQTTPAVFDSSAAKFEWTPTGTELGDYSVQFTVTDSSAQPLSASETISITVMTTTVYGRAMYEKHCATCHGFGGMGSNGPNIRGKTALAISNAIQSVSVMQTLQDSLSARDLEHIAEHLMNLSHIQYELSLACVACHDGAQAVGKNVSHIATSNLCAACHTLDAWLPFSKVDHTQVIGTCVSCHNKLLAHARTTERCEACHAIDAWAPVTKAQIQHSEVLAGSCADCHTLNTQ